MSADITFSTVCSNANGDGAKSPYFKNAQGRGYGKVVEILTGRVAPYKVERNNSVVGFVKPVNTF